MAKKGPVIGAGGIIALAGIGLLAYLFLKGKLKLPTLPSFPSLPPDLPFFYPDYNVTYNESGLPGVIGQTAYGSIYGNLRPRVEENIPRAIKEVQGLGDDDYVPDPAGIYARSVAMTVSEDIHEKGVGSFLGIPGYSLSPLSLLFGRQLPFGDPAVTIGAGFGAISQQDKYYRSLPDELEETARYQESMRRFKFMTSGEGVFSSVVASSMPFTAPLIKGMFMSDVARLKQYSGKQIKQKIKRISQPLTGKIKRDVPEESGIVRYSGR